MGGNPYTPTATGGASGNPVIFTIDASASAVCSISAGEVSFVTVGTCLIDANQAGNDNWEAAAQVQQSFPVAKGDQAITFTIPAPASASVGGSYTPAATGGGSGNPVVITVDASAAGFCSINGSGLVSFIGVGTCVVDANQGGNGNWNAAPQAQQSFAIKNNQTITFGTTPPASVVVGGAAYAPGASGELQPAGYHQHRRHGRLDLLDQRGQRPF